MVQMTQAAKIRKAWEAAGSPPCSHPDADREYYLGSSTGDYVCTTCGEIFTRDEWLAIKADR
jgi:hypothetical protein